jgi:hypothetical protein
MAKITLGEIALPGERFPQLLLDIDGKLYLIDAVDASRFGRQMNDAARSTVSRVDTDVLRNPVATVEITPL